MSDDELTRRLRSLDAEAWDPVAPPPLRLPEPERKPRRRVVLRPAFALAAAVALLVAGGVTGALLDGEGTPSSIALKPLKGEPPGVRARVSLGEGTIHLRVSGATPTPAGHVEELWFLAADGQPVSVGSYVVGRDGRADVTFRTDQDPSAYRYVDVSIEPTDGDPAHSSESVLRSAALS